MRINKLNFNTSKSEFKVLGHRRKLNRASNALPSLVLNNEAVKRVKKIKYLGINIEEASTGSSDVQLSSTSSKGAYTL